MCAGVDGCQCTKYTRVGTPTEKKEKCLVQWASYHEKLIIGLDLMSHPNGRHGTETMEIHVELPH